MNYNSEYEQIITLDIKDKNYQINLKNGCTVLGSFWRASCADFPYLDEYGQSKEEVLNLITDSIEITEINKRRILKIYQVVHQPRLFGQRRIRIL